MSFINEKYYPYILTIGFMAGCFELYAFGMYDDVFNLFFAICLIPLSIMGFIIDLGDKK